MLLELPSNLGSKMVLSGLAAAYIRAQFGAVPPTEVVRQSRHTRIRHVPIFILAQPYSKTGVATSKVTTALVIESSSPAVVATT